jgi:hypothetical protein
MKKKNPPNNFSPQLQHRRADAVMFTALARLRCALNYA